VRPIFSLLFQPVMIGTGASLGLLGSYYLLVGLVQSWSHAVEVITGDPLYVAAITAGFGIQIGLYIYIKKANKLIRSGKMAALTASGTGASSVSMLACCLHHLGDILPLIGLSGAALFFENYRYPLMIGGILMNILSITLMLGLINKNSLWPRCIFAE